MYGLIHTAIKDMVLKDHGETIWTEIFKTAGAKDDQFLTMSSYDDSVTMALVTAACDVLKVEPAVCLELFGIHWVCHTAREAYPQMLASYGGDMFTLLSNLDYMHDRISSSFPGFDAPSFLLQKTSDSSYLLEYRSSRVGLEAFVVGLIKGLGKVYSQNVRISIVNNEQGDDGQVTQFLLEVFDS